MTHLIGITVTGTSMVRMQTHCFPPNLFEPWEIKALRNNCAFVVFRTTSTSCSSAQQSIQ